MSATQTTLRFKTATVLKPLVDLQAAAAIAGADYSEEEILADIEAAPGAANHIGWAWNIASAASDKREIRVFAPAVADRDRGFDFDDVLAVIFPEQRWAKFRKPAVRGATLARRLACTRAHVLTLIHERSIRQLGSVCRGGRNGSPDVTWPSITAFFQDRLITTQKAPK